MFRRRDHFGVQRPQSREEVIRTHCDLKNREIVLADDYRSRFQVTKKVAEIFKVLEQLCQ